MFLGTLVADFKKVGGEIKSFIISVAEGAPKVVATVIADEQKIEPVIEAFVPGSAAAFAVADTLLNHVAQAVEDAGTAATSNGLSVTLDQALVNDLKALIAAAKAAFTNGHVTPATPPAPTAPAASGK